MKADGYQPKNWSMKPRTINQWGGPPPPRFLLTGFPIAASRAAALSPSQSMER
jgi:hypothetical protein